MQDFAGWNVVAEKLMETAAGSDTRLNEGQKAGLAAIADRIVGNGVILADEVGMGKTRIAVELARAVIEAHGRVAIIVPPGLGFQWQKELKDGGIVAPPILRSLWNTLETWRDGQSTRPWFDENVVVVSHNFSNWRVRENGKSWRWALLPELFALWRKEKRGRRPRGFWAAKELNDHRVRRAAQGIFAFAGRAAKGVRQAYSSRIDEIFDGKSWQSALDGREYHRDGELRSSLEKAVGLCLGCFDLVIVDEAHKSRRDESGLSRMVNDVLLESRDVRRLAMTATPMELHAEQWLQTLARVTAGRFAHDELRAIIETYAQATRKVRASWRSDPAARQAFAEAAAAFQQACGRYIVRRGKNEDPSVRRFTELTGKSYRRERAEKIGLGSLQRHWLAALCGAEALSYLAPDTRDQRMRLTFCNGHGLANVVDSISFHDAGEDARRDAGEEDGSLAAGLAAAAADAGAKVKAREDWWKASIKRALQKEGKDLYGHPAIIKAVEIIESRTSVGEKVLVFGRYTKPLRALTQILNARAMIKALQAGQAWPQSKIPDAGLAAVAAALAQLRSGMDIEQVVTLLGERHGEMERERAKLHDKLLDLIEEGLEAREGELYHLLVAARQRGKDGSFLGNLARAMSDFLGTASSVEPKAYATAFGNLVIALRHQNEGDDNDDGLDQDEAHSLWEALAERLKEEYGGQKSAFARMMYGGTEHNTRRLLQFAFNREQSFPRVLVAQSAVGREGLNLHEACRTVVLLHPEWNPGIAEQQIGRVDRVGSLWARELDLALQASVPPDQLRRIEIIPVIFEGTYDEHNWSVLNERWDDLRAQLHGIVVPERLRDAQDEEGMQLARELDRAAPNFSPVKDSAGVNAVLP